MFTRQNLSRDPYFSSSNFLVHRSKIDPNPLDSWISVEFDRCLASFEQTWQILTSCGKIQIDFRTNLIRTRPANFGVIPTKSR